MQQSGIRISGAEGATDAEEKLAKSLLASDRHGDELAEQSEFDVVEIDPEVAGSVDRSPFPSP
ncbi:MAG TPA: hypothetical protein VFZ91_00135 [Allosphingosinicella sp.]